ncbi:hypothetical protein N9C84_02815 [Desulfobacterales bacterium]|nr:hypothetical protein [Desulfobacterales bacterium]
MRIKNYCYFTIILFIIIVNSGYSATYYVKNSGNDNASGVSDINAWATITKVNEFAKNRNFSDGDVICFKRGDIFDDATIGYDGDFISWGNIDGLTFQDYGLGEKPKFISERKIAINISGSGISNLTIKNIYLYGSSSTKVVWLNKINGVTIDGVDGDGRGSGSPIRPDGVIKLLNVVGDVTIRNCNLHHWGPKINPTKGVEDTIALYIWTGLGKRSPTSIQIYDNIVHSINSDAVHIGNFQGQPGNTCNIYNNEFYNCGENAIDMKASTYVNIHNNTMYREDFGLGGTGGPGALIIIHTSTSFPGVKCDEVSLYDNQFLGNNDGVYTLGGIYFTTGHEDTYIYGNRFENVSPALRTSYGNHLIERNIFVANQPLNIDSSLKTFIRQETTAVVKNNTFYASQNSNITTGIWHRNNWESSYSNNIIYLNSVSSSSYPLFVNKGTGNLPEINYNNLYNPLHQNIVYWNGTEYEKDGISAWRTAVDAGALSCDPLFSDVQSGNFSLLKSSCSILPNRILGAIYISSPEELDLKNVNK